MTNNEDVLSEIVKLLATLPNNFKDKVTLEWLGQTRYLFSKSDDVSLSVRAYTVIQNATDPLKMRGLGAKEELIVLISQLKKEFEAKCGYSIPRNYEALSEPAKESLTTSASILRDAIREDNELDPENKEVLLSEIAVFEATIAAPRASAELISRFVSSVLKGTIITLAGAVANNFASKLVDAIMKVLPTLVI